MGIYDRPYLQEEEYGGGNWSPGRSMVFSLIIVNSVIWLATGLFDIPLKEWLELPSNLFTTRPWQVWRLLSYGFVHENIGHLIFNMLGLYFFGRDVEGIYGRFEFLRIYLAAILVAGIVWMVFQATSSGPANLVGASGGVLAMVMLSILHYPMRMILFWGVLPMRGWVLGTIYIGLDVLGLLGIGQPERGPQVANIAHLAGVGFAYAYFRGKLNLGRLIPTRLADLKPRGFRPKLRIHDPDKKARDLSREVDAILEKISREGESSLTRKERKTLEEASRQYQRRKQP